MFGVAKDFRATHGEEAFKILAGTAFTEADVDKSGTIDKSELRATLKKLGIHLTGATATILTEYDTSGDGQIDEQEFLTLASDLIDGSFDTKIKPAVEKAQQEQQQKQVAAQQQQLAAGQQALAAQQMMAQQQVVAGQQQLAASIKTLQSELAASKASNEALKDQNTRLEKRVRVLEGKVQDFAERFKDMDTKARQKNLMDELEDDIALKSGAMADEVSAAKRKEAEFSAARESFGGSMQSMSAAQAMIAAQSAPKVPAVPAKPAKKKGLFG